MITVIRDAIATMAMASLVASSGQATCGVMSHSLGVRHGHAKWETRLPASLAADKDSASPPHTHTNSSHIQELIKHLDDIWVMPPPHFTLANNQRFP